ncbi:MULTISPECIES: hypothetical protein [unclassified Bacillus (in: firmicutes)]|uniref:hypothetical protein n=1 Tax=unclassified Bacillus (in: firmicutes) TaxID=185979 RepID=UPI0008ED7EE6|nr:MULTISPECIES: hypothetical protein [unclassified Bacillus (in: firmicutes)]SFA71024.1 hypothetical protein SAMN02799634_101170 [Bacillus sp. UNCCL13]SFQ61071.1 hypothetical protein SAMN04488577_0455 [Bacillus sp. cl95]
MTLAWFVLLVCGGFIFIGYMIDFFAKNRNLQKSREHGMEGISESEKIQNEMYLKSTMDDYHNPYS